MYVSFPIRVFISSRYRARISFILPTAVISPSHLGVRHGFLSALFIWCICCCYSFTKSCLTLCNPKNCRISGSSVLHCLPEFAQIHVYWVGNAIWPSRPLPPFLILPSVFPRSGSFLMSWYFTLGGQSMGASISASVLPMKIWVSFALGLTNLILRSRDFQEFSPVPQFESINSSMFSLLCAPTLTSVYDCWKKHSFDYMDLCQQSDVLLFNMLSRFVITFLPRSKHLVISWLQSWSTVILEPKKIKSVTVSTFFPSAMKWCDQMP